VGVTRAAVVAAVAAVLTISGCSSSGDSSPTSPTATASGPTSSAAPSTTDPTSDAEAQAIAFVPAYLRMIDDLRLDPSRPLDDIYQVAVPPEATAQASAVGELRSQNYRQTGRSQLVTTEVDSDAAASSPTPSTVVVSACIDVTDVGAVDAAGQSVVPPGRPGFLVTELTLVNPTYSNAASWRVSEAVNRQAESCGA
jgi:hypothetical protein